MSHCQILPPPLTVEDTIDEVALISYNCSESAFNFEAWQETSLCGLPSLPLYFPPQATAAPSTDSSPKAVIHSVPLQFQPQRCKGKTPAQSQGPTLSNTKFQGLWAQLQQLQQEKEAALAQVQKLRNQ